MFKTSIVVGMGLHGGQGAVHTVVLSSKENIGTIMWKTKYRIKLW